MPRLRSELRQLNLEGQQRPVRACKHPYSVHASDKVTKFHHSLLLQFLTYHQGLYAQVSSVIRLRPLLPSISLSPFINNLPPARHQQSAYRAHSRNMILTILAITLFHYFPRLRHTILEGNRNYGQPKNTRDGVVSSSCIRLRCRQSSV